jgi:hypothetical protein
MDKVKSIFTPVVIQYVAIACIVLLVLWYAKSKADSFFTSDTIDNKIDEENPLTVDFSNLTSPIDQYLIWADSLYAAMNHAGTSWTPIIDVFSQMRTNDDVSELINAYGVRTLYVFGIPTQPKNLPQSLTTEQSGSWFGVEDVNEVLEANNITLRF